MYSESEVRRTLRPRDRELDDIAAGSVELVHPSGTLEAQHRGRTEAEKSGGLIARDRAWRPDHGVDPRHLGNQDAVAHECLPLAGADTELGQLGDRDQPVLASSDWRDRREEHG